MSQSIVVEPNSQITLVWVKANFFISFWRILCYQQLLADFKVEHHSVRKFGFGKPYQCFRKSSTDQILPSGFNINVIYYHDASWIFIWAIFVKMTKTKQKMMIILKERSTQLPASGRKGSRKEKISSDKFARLPEKCLFGRNWFRRKGKLKTIGLSLQQN